MPDPDGPHTPLLDLPAERRHGEADRAAALEAEQRRNRREAWIVLGICWCWIVLALPLLFWSLHARDADRGAIAFWAAMGLGYGGSTFTLVVYYFQRAERDGH